MPKHFKLRPIDEELIATRLQFENPWWSSGKIDEDYDEMQPRLYFDLFYPLVKETDVKRAVVFMGPRRVGKTVMLHHAIQKLLRSKVARKRICFISIDNPLYLHRGLEELFTLARQTSGELDPKGWFVFFDEIQYLKDWEVHLKSLVDTYPNTKFIVSGSAAAALKLKSNESGAGRFTDFTLPPLNFHEYLHFIKQTDKALSTEELNKHFLDYINFGGYPEVIFSDKIKANPGRYIKNDIIDKVLLRDLPSLYGIQDPQELNNFFAYLAYHSGKECSLDTLSKNCHIQKPLLKKYLEYLEAAFLIRIVHRIDDNSKKFQRATLYKIVLTNPSLRCAMFAPLKENDADLGYMIETAVYAQLHQDPNFTPYYARWKTGSFEGEVDLVFLDLQKFKPRTAVEIKWSNCAFEKPKQELKGLFDFCKKNLLKSALVTTLDQRGTKEMAEEGISCTFIPTAYYALGMSIATFGINAAKISQKLGKQFTTLLDQIFQVNSTKIQKNK